MKQIATNFPDSPGSITRRQLPKHQLLQARSATKSAAERSAGSGDAGGDVNTLPELLPLRGGIRGSFIYSSQARASSCCLVLAASPPGGLVARGRAAAFSPSWFGDIKTRSHFITPPHTPWFSREIISEHWPICIFLGKAWRLYGDGGGTPLPTQDGWLHAGGTPHCAPLAHARLHLRTWQS